MVALTGPFVKPFAGRVAVEGDDRGDLVAAEQPGKRRADVGEEFAAAPDSLRLLRGRLRVDGKAQAAGRGCPGLFAIAEMDVFVGVPGVFEPVGGLVD